MRKQTRKSAVFWLTAAVAVVSAVTSGCRSLSSEAGAREGRLAVPGGYVWYRVAGANKPGIPLLVLHGGPGMPHDYLESLEAFADERPVVFYDQLGSGNSEQPTNRSLWTVERFVDELAVVRRQLGLRRVHLFGHGWGATLAVEYLLGRNPKGIVSLTLASPALIASRWTADQRGLVGELPAAQQAAIAGAESAGQFSGTEYEAALNEYEKRHVCRLDPLPADVAHARAKKGVEVYATMRGPDPFMLGGALAHYDRADDLATLRVPTLFTCGRFDTATPATCAFYHAKLPGSRLAIFEDASHLHLVEKRQEFLATLRRFLNDTETHGIESVRKS